MKNLILTVSAALMAIFVLQGCEKQTMSDPLTNTTPQILTHKTQVYPYDGGDTLLYTGAAATDSLEWTVTPAANTYIRQKGNVAIIIFGNVGSHVVTAKKIGSSTSASITMTVVSSTTLFKSDGLTTSTNVTTSTSDTLKIEPITGDVKLWVIYYRNPVGDSVMINFSAYTMNTFCSRATMQFKSVLGNDRNYSLDLINIRGPKGCAGAVGPNTSAGISGIFVPKLMGFGNHALNITLNGVTYTGSINVTANNTVINWPYTTGVIMDLKVIDK
jgi:hypothetical protein